MIPYIIPYYPYVIIYNSFMENFIYILKIVKDIKLSNFVLDNKIVSVLITIYLQIF